MRTSSYIIPVKLESETNKYMLIHGYTGAADVVTENLLEKLMAFPTTNSFSDKILQNLIKRGYITTKSKEEEHDYVVRIAKALHKESNILSTSFTWVVSYNCNFRCPYCFENKEIKDGNQKLTFTKEQVDIAFKSQDAIQPHPQLRNNVITLYGGEPLLAENKEIITYIIQEGHKRGYQFIAITNGYEIDQFEHLLGNNGIYRLQVTIDGSKEIHDSRRIHYKNGATFDKIIANIQLALNKGVKVVVRMNSDGRNINQYTELKTFFEKKHFFDYPHFYFYIARLRDYYDITVKEQQGLNFMSPQTFINKQKEISFTPFTLDTGYYKDIYNALVRGRSIPFRPVACKAQSSEYVLDPLGNIYPCWETVGKKEHIKGTYSDKGITWNVDVYNKWRNINIMENETCRMCKYVLFCGGGCPYHKMIQKNDQQCVTFKTIFNIAINKAYAELSNN